MTDFFAEPIVEAIQIIPRKIVDIPKPLEKPVVSEQKEEKPLEIKPESKKYNWFQRNIFKVTKYKEEQSRIKKEKQQIKEKITNSINKNNYLYTNMQTPILTVKSEKYDDLYNELLKNGILAEKCSQYINLNEQYVRIRINKKYKKVIKILNKVL